MRPPAPFLSCRLLLSCLLGLWSCVPAWATEAIRLDYLEHEPGAPGYQARVLITPTFLRQDFGADDDGYLLFDRTAGVVYSVNADDHSILEVARSGAAIGESPLPLTLTESSHREADAPLIDGRAPLFTDYRANGELCYQTVSVTGLLPEALAAWREFRGVMAAQRATTLENTPSEFLSACVLANSIFAPLHYLNHGLPIREYSRTGLSRELVGIEPTATVADGLFRLPPDYRSLTLGAAAR